jgi:flagellar biosynthesis GTPase FlhF
MTSNDLDTGLSYPLVLITVIGSIVLAAGITLLASPDDPQTFSRNRADDRIGPLIERIERIEQRLDVLEGASVRPASDLRESADDADSTESLPADLYQRVARLETIEQDRQEEARRQAEQRRVIEEARRAERAQLAAAAAATMMDPAADDQSKAQAWQRMRMSAPDAWTDEVVAEAVRIGMSSQDPQLRADIWRQAHANHTHPMLLQPLLQALASDANNFVREEAAETLDLYLDQPGVREALELAAQYDAHPSVRRQATISLAGPTGGF